MTACAAAEPPVNVRFTLNVGEYVSAMRDAVGRVQRETEGDTDG